MRLRRQFAERPAKDLKPQLAGEQPVNAVGHPVGIIQCALFHPVPDEIPARRPGETHQRLHHATQIRRADFFIAQQADEQTGKGMVVPARLQGIKPRNQRGFILGRELAATMTTSALAESRLIISRMGRLTWRESSFHISEVICQYGGQPGNGAGGPRARRTPAGHHTARAIAVSRWLPRPPARLQPMTWT